MDNVVIQPYLLLIARFLISILFLYAGIYNACHWSILKNALAQKKFPVSGFLLTIAIIFEISAAILIIIGFHVKIVALLLIPFTLISILVFHDFWHKPPGEVRDLNFIIFFTHITATLSALVFLIAVNN